jgi:hypothetical protein
MTFVRQGFGRITISYLRKGLPLLWRTLGDLERTISVPILRENVRAPDTL